jgi:hypothetical protein
MLLGVSRTLRHHLEASIPNSSGAGWVQINALEHQEPPSLPTNKLLVFLWAVEENPFMRNAGPVARPDGAYVPAPLALTLQYLVTYISNTPTDVQEWLSEVARVFASRPRLGPADLDPQLKGVVDHLTVRLRTPSLEDLNRFWTALNVGMRLSLFYEVDAALIAPSEPDAVGPVERRRLVLTREPVA